LPAKSGKTEKIKMAERAPIKRVIFFIFFLGLVV